MTIRYTQLMIIFYSFIFKVVLFSYSIVNMRIVRFDECGLRKNNISIELFLKIICRNEIFCNFTANYLI